MSLGTSFLGNVWMSFLQEQIVLGFCSSLSKRYLKYTTSGWVKTLLHLVYSNTIKHADSLVGIFTHTMRSMAASLALLVRSTLTQVQGMHCIPESCFCWAKGVLSNAEVLCVFLILLHFTLQSKFLRRLANLVVLLVDTPWVGSHFIFLLHVRDCGY